jgi:lactoylglutathione lyase
MLNLIIVEILVADMETGRAFYCEKLGFKVKSEAYLPQVLVLEHEGVDLILDQAAKPAQIDYPDSSGTMAIFQTADIQAAAEDYRAKGIEIVDGPRETPPGDFLAFKDPFGNVHGLMQPRAG